MKTDKNPSPAPGPSPISMGPAASEDCPCLQMETLRLPLPWEPTLAIFSTRHVGAAASRRPLRSLRAAPRAPRARRAISTNSGGGCRLIARRSNSVAEVRYKSMSVARRVDNGWHGFCVRAVGSDALALSGFASQGLHGHRVPTAPSPTSCSRSGAREGCY